ncbi:hypothetical protein SD457_02495 [Coprobacillaceae bacterium CR2/5/TPMF4]|nr:hypothetical protein SD457_02495 [Coprobacillaceae bacterium CR2/5/TPMF4]
MPLSARFNEDEEDDDEDGDFPPAFIKIEESNKLTNVSLFFK